MPSASYQKFQPYIEIMNEAGDAGADTYSVRLATAINLAAGTFTEVAAGGNYSTGGNSAAVSSSAQSGGTYKLVLADPATWTATGGGFTFQYAVLYNNTRAAPVAAWDYGSSQVVAAGETVTVDLDQTNGVYTVA